MILLGALVARRWWIIGGLIEGRCLQPVQLILVQLSGDVAARPARLRRITRLRWIAGGWRVSWRWRRIVRKGGRRIVSLGGWVIAVVGVRVVIWVAIGLREHRAEGESSEPDPDRGTRTDPPPMPAPPPLCQPPPASAGRDTVTDPIARTDAARASTRPVLPKNLSII
jgi:hypothetical protein